MKVGFNAQLINLLATIHRLEDAAQSMPMTGPTPVPYVQDGGSIHFHGNHQKAPAFEAFGSQGWESVVAAGGMSVNLSKRLINGVTVVIENVAELQYTPSEREI